MQTWITDHTLFVVFAGVCFVAFGLQYAWLRKVPPARMPWLAWLFALLLLGLGWRLTEQAGRRERDRIQNLTQDFARLYGSELEKRGHWKLPDDVAANDPLYLSLIETEINWEKLNPDVSDIYTLRKLPDGKNIFIVDSETDYNRNGRYDEEREQRTPVGEVYSVADAGLERAFRGEANFDFAPVTDRWGTWVSAFVPLHDPSGRVEGVMGVDFDAHEFVATINNAKLRILSLLALLQLVVLGASTLNSVLRAQIIERKKNEESLRFLGSAVEQARESIIITDAELDLPGPRIIFVNPAFTQMTGYPAAEVIGKTPRILQGPRTDRTVLARLRQNLESGEAFEGQTFNYRKDGREYFSESQIAPLRNAAGKTTHFVAIQRDITERQRAAEVLRESERRFSDMLRNLELVSVMLDQEARITYCNDYLLQLTGWRREEVAGRDWFETFLPPEIVDGVRNVFSALLANDPAAWHHENQIVTRSGARRLIRWNNSLLRSASGEIIGVASIGEDITEHKQAENLVRQSQERYRSLVENARDAIFTIAPDGTFTSLNPAAGTIGGISRADWIGQPFVPMVHPEDVPLATEMFRRVLMGEHVPTHELRGHPSLSRPATMEMTLAAQRDGDEKIIGVMGIGRDITERKLMEDRLFQSQKMETVGKLAGGIAHEFNSILTAIIGQSELLLQDLPPGDSKCKNAVEISKAAGRAATLTRQLLAYGRKQFLKPEILNLNRIILNMEGVYHHLLGSAVDMQIVPATGLHPVKADAGQIEQVIMNLIINAIDAMPNGGKLTLETANVQLDGAYLSQFPDVELKAGDYVMLAVSDTGAGMSPEVKARAFEPFYSTKDVGQGTGLGLSTCYGIIKQSGGHISLYSEPGRGTTFKIYLPQAESQVEIPPRRIESTQLPRGTETILLVEDDPALREMAATLLRRLGYNVFEVANGLEALQLTRQPNLGRIDLLFTDVVMPHMGGKELAGQIKVLYPHTRILFTSAYTENAIVHQGVLEHGVALLQKPFTPSALAHRVRGILDAGKT
ncbi:MAG TPA: PAS domain S-box protein [Verrucomicrobiae bacterium]|nr:PAS domain S-box protein [Verrucomicrobiae bacterium]